MPQRPVHAWPVEPFDPDPMNAPSKLREGLIRGAGFGLAYTVGEATLDYFPAAIHNHIQEPLHAILTAIPLEVALGALLGLLAAPLLSLKRGGLRHTLACTALLATVAFAVAPAFQTARIFIWAMVLAAPLLYGLSRWLRRRPALARLPLPAAVLILLAAFGLPRLLSPAGPELPARTGPAPAHAPNLLFIVIDTVRADHVNLYAYGRETAPELARFAQEGAVFERAIAPATWTLPSHASMFTGLYPSAHGANHEGNYLAAENTTLAEILYAAGWTTVGFNANPWITESNGMAQGFERLEPSWLMMMAPMHFLAYRIGARLGLLFEDHGAREVTKGWTRWVREEWNGERPFFAFLNFIESHFPYQTLPPGARDRYVAKGTPPGAMRVASDHALGAQLFGDPVSEGDARTVRDLYDAGIRYEDALVARAVDALRERGVLDETVIFIVADHGELFGEHGLYGHDLSLSERLLHVPLVIRYPRRVPEGVRVTAPVSLVGLFATALDLLGVEVPQGTQARSLVPLFDEKPLAAASPLLSEQHRFSGVMPGVYKEHGPFDRMGVRYRALEVDGWKLVEDSLGHRWLFQPGEDPDELDDRAKARPELAARLSLELDSVVKGLGLGDINAEKLGPGGHVALDPAARERLRSLGYVQ
jgi:arylsulfatase A-like enzyme